MKYLFGFYLSFFLVVLCANPHKTFSQSEKTRFDFESDLEYNSKIPSPSAFFGYEPGEEFTFYHDAVDYLLTLDKLSPLITVKQYGETYERRKLYYLTITSEDNQKNLETIRQAHLKLLDPLQTSKNEAETLIKDQPVVTSLSYNIHGNEASGMEAALQVAYRLCAANDPDMQEVLNNSVILIFPCINPDGHDRYTYRYRSMEQQESVTDINELEHHWPWLNGRTNHYWFDLNRDWFWGVHPESRGHSGVIQQWMPQIHIDNHEQNINSNYFTMPGTTPRNKLLPDDWEQFSAEFGKANIEAFNKHGITYTTHEPYDFFFPGYGSSYPGLLGAIAMLTEQGGGVGRAVETRDGYILTLRQRIFDHYITSLASIVKAASMRKDLLKFTYNALNPVNSKTKTAAYILPDNPSGHLYKLIKTLRRNGVEIEQTTESFTIKKALDYKDGKISETKFEKGTFLIKTNQNRHTLINTIMARNLEIEDSVTYDMLSWSAPLAYNLEAYSSDLEPEVSSTILKVDPRVPSGLNNPNAHYAYVINWKQPNAPSALSGLWKKGYRVRIAGKPFRYKGQNYSRGTLIILMGRNIEKQKTALTDMQEIALTNHVIIDALDNGQMTEGPDLASKYNKPVEKPKVALLVGNPFHKYICGENWFLFDRMTNFSLSRIQTSSFLQSATNNFSAPYGSTDLNDYDVLILPGGGSKLKSIFQEKQLKQLKDWVIRGGVLIAEESAVSWLTNEQSGFTDIHLVKILKDTTSDEARYLRYEDREDFYGLKYIPGAALRTTIDDSNPLAFGLDQDLYSLKFGTTALKPSVKMQTVGYYQKDSTQLLTAGYSSKENLNQLAGQTYAGVLQMGKGKVVLLVDKTQYRMFWIGPSRMLQNAVMLLPGF